MLYPCMSGCGSKQNSVLGDNFSSRRYAIALPKHHKRRSHFPNTTKAIALPKHNQKAITCGI
ncbi:MAG: hypothetical protein V7K50_30670 [Nostoc sp.]|uniref:hypothetical protein n=1 Tax=Nostoc sp. TaxID=1180 RepID=UPI002FF78295